jgi:dolichyl-diphosphooligosaccharide---protein glycosyltransferase
MQVTAVLLKKYVVPNMSINDVCVLIPAWFGVMATLSVAWLTYECTRGTHFRCILTDIVPLAPLQKYGLRPLGMAATKLAEKYTGTSLGLASRNQSPLTPLFCAVFAAGIMSIVPAHLLRSIGGGYDNESVAVTAMVLTFSSWVLSMREHVSLTQTILFGILTGFFYFYMVAAWGGYVFVLNLIAAHAGFLVLIGRYSSKLHRAYTAFYIVGTALAVQVPVVGWTPLKSLEQLSALAAFGGLQLLEICQVLRIRRKLNRKKTLELYAAVFGSAAAVVLILVYIVAPTGYFGPISSRVRGLFVKHTKTGNPLVDSVAEHQASSPGAYFQYLHDVCYIAPVGLVFTCLAYWNDPSSFLLVYSAAAYYFSHRMVRLILLTGPIASVLGGICLGRMFAWMLDGIMELVMVDSDYYSPHKTIDSGSERSDSSNQSASKKGKGKNGKKSEVAKKINADKQSSPTQWIRIVLVLAKVLGSIYLVKQVFPNFQMFHKMSHMIAQQISHPTIIQKARLRDGTNVMVDDYREAYFWLRDNTPEDARIMAWWDCKSFY